jgi:DNA-binding NarL/FixJ family response regulator
MSELNGEGVRVLLADGRSLLRDAVRAALESHVDLRVVAIAADGMQAVAEAIRTSPDVAILDADLPNCDGVQATRAILERLPACRVLIVGDADDDAILLAAIEAGASGFVTKEEPISDLVEAARSLRRGDMLVPKPMLGGLISGLLQHRREYDAAVRAAAHLTRRERQVIGLAAGGADNDEIARSLVISPQTVRTHIQHALGKLGAHSRREAVTLLSQSGLGKELQEATG